MFFVACYDMSYFSFNLFFNIGFKEGVKLGDWFDLLFSNKLGGEIVKGELWHSNEALSRSKDKFFLNIFLHKIEFMI